MGPALHRVARARSTKALKIVCSLHALFRSRSFSFFFSTGLLFRGKVPPPLLLFSQSKLGKRSALEIHFPLFRVKDPRPFLLWHERRKVSVLVWSSLLPPFVLYMKIKTTVCCANESKRKTQIDPDFRSPLPLVNCSSFISCVEVTLTWFSSLGNRETFLQI